MKVLSAALLLAATAAAQHDLTGKWSTSVDTFGTPTSWNLTLEQKGERIAGELGGDKLRKAR